MVDIETMSSKPHGAIASIGAVAFDPYGNDTVAGIEASRKFYVNLNMRDQISRHFDPDTLYWWLTQSPAAQRALVDPVPVPTIQGLLKYSDWCFSQKADRFWCLGATFDHVLMQTLFTSVARKNPAHYSRQLCFRSIAKFSGLERPEIPELVGHNALDDAIKQAIWMQQCIKHINFPPRGMTAMVESAEIMHTIITERTNEQQGPEVSSK